jgi:hypothetical protein
MSRLGVEGSCSISLDFPLSMAEDKLSIAMALRQVRRPTWSTTEDQAALRWSHTIRNTRIKKIWSMTDSRWCFDRGKGGVLVTASSCGLEGDEEDWCRDGEDCERFGDERGNRKDFDDHVLTL